MDIINYTPFSPFYFRHEDQHGEPFNVFLLKGRFHIEHGEMLRVSRKPAEINFSDLFRREDNTGSLRESSDLAPIKESTDVTVVGKALAPNGELMNSWPVKIEVGDISRSLIVHGPRNWNWSPLTGWRMSRSERVGAVELCHENFFGGETVRKGGGQESHLINPVGKGFLGDRDKRQILPAHVIEDFESPVHNPRDASHQFGTNPICRHWNQRARFTGTADQNWRETRWPHLPEDFDFRFYNHAPESMQSHGFFVGGEKLRLDGFGERTIESSLPILDVGIVATDEDSQTLMCGMNLDSVHIDVDRWEADLTWRVAFENLSALQRIETGMFGRVGVRNGAE